MARLFFAIALAAFAAVFAAAQQDVCTSAKTEADCLKEGGFTACSWCRGQGCLAQAPNSLTCGNASRTDCNDEPQTTCGKLIGCAWCTSFTFVFCLGRHAALKSSLP